MRPVRVVQAKKVRTAADRAARRATLVAMAWAAATAPGPLSGED